MARIMALVDNSPKKDHLYEVAGDAIVALPRHLDNLERHLDRLEYALAATGQEHLKDRIPLSDRKMVENAIEDAQIAMSSIETGQPLVSRVAQRYADLNPPLGIPGGPCQVTQRIQDQVRNPALQEDLIEDFQEDGELANPEASKVYSLSGEGPANGTRFKELVLTAHAQFRMDLRGISVDQVKKALLSFQNALGAAKSAPASQFLAKKWEEQLMRGDDMRWEDPKQKLTIGFVAGGDARRVVLVTAFWTNKPTPRVVPVQSCPAR